MDFAFASPLPESDDAAFHGDPAASARPTPHAATLPFPFSASRRKRVYPNPLRILQFHDTFHEEYSWRFLGPNIASFYNAGKTADGPDDTITRVPSVQPVDKPLCGQAGEKR